MNTDTATLKDLLDPVCSIAKDAGTEIMKIYDKGFEVSEKHDNSPLTEADMASHHLIIEALAKLTPGTPILSEESDNLSFEVRSSWQTYWLIDPLDGTKEFIKRNGEFTVNIALIHKHESVLGVVYAPARDLLYYASRGQGACKDGGGTSHQAISARKALGKPPIIVGSRSHPTPGLAEFLANMGEYDLTSMGSSLKSCLVAEGAADIYPRFGLTSEWDTAAAQCVVEEAGAHLTTMDMQPLRYNTKESLLNPHFLVFGAQGFNWIPRLPAAEK